MKQANQFKLVECGGTAYEIGLQWGEGCRDHLRQIAQDNFRHLESTHHATEDQVTAQAMKFLPRIQQFDPYLVELMKGQAAAAGMSFAAILTQRCMNELVFYYGQISGLCTGFAATGSATAGGQTLLGQNVDWSQGAIIDFLKIHHKGGPDQYVLNFANSTELTLSSAGYGICGLATVGRNYALNLPLGCYMPRVMRQKNIHDAMELLKQVARGVAYFQLADADGVLLGIESTPDDYEVIRPRDDLLLHSNHYLTERFRHDDLTAHLTEIGAFPPVMARESLKRYERIRSLMYKDFGRITARTAMAALADHEHYPLSICRHDEQSTCPSTTLASFVMAPAEGAIYIACGHPCEQEFVRYTFS